jgi:hypothetical protein
MENFTLEKDIKVFYITATSFPEGIMEAHEKMHALVADKKGRRFFGISRPENKGAIVYKAAAEELQEGEAEKLNCESMMILKGEYIGTTILNYPKDVQSISKAFDKLLRHPGLDPYGYCVEWYLNENDVRCMVRLK